MTGTFHEKLRLFDTLHHPHRPPSTLALFSCRVKSIWIMIVEVRDRFKGLALIDRVPEELWTEVCDIVKEAMIKAIPKKKEMPVGKMVV